MSARTSLALSALAAVLAGCDDPADPPATLTEAEALALFKSVTEGLGLVPGEDAASGPVDTTVACPLGGRAQIAGTAAARTVADTARMQMSAVVTPAGCKVPAGDMTFTVDGDPGIRTEWSVAIVGFEKIIMAGVVEGDIRWQLEDRSGDCAIDMPLDATADFSNPEGPGVTGGFKGKMCGHDVQLDIPAPSLD